MLRKGHDGLYKAPTKKERKKEEIERPTRDGDQIKFIDLRFERWQVIRFWKVRRRQDVPHTDINICPIKNKRRYKSDKNSLIDAKFTLIFPLHFSNYSLTDKTDFNPPSLPCPEVSKELYFVELMVKHNENLRSTHFPFCISYSKYFCFYSEPFKMSKCCLQTYLHPFW